MIKLPSSWTGQFPVGLASKLLARVAIRFLLSKSLIQQFLRLKVKFSLLIYGNAQETKRVHVKIINSLEFTSKQSLRRIFIFFHKFKNLFKKIFFLFPVPYCVLHKE